MSIKVLTLFGEEVAEEPVAKAERKKKPARKSDEPVAEPSTADNTPATSEADDTAVPAPAKKKQQKPAKNLQRHSNTPQILEGWKAEKQYYGIGEVARLFGVNVSHIRFWTNEFEIKVRTNRKGDRMFNEENIALLRTIYHLVKEKGFTIAGAKIKLKEQRKSSNTTLPGGEYKIKLLALRAQLVALKNRI